MGMPDSVSNMSTDVSTSSSIISSIEQILEKGDDKRTDSISIFEVLRMYQNIRELSQTILEQNTSAIQSINSIFKVNISATCVYVYIGNKHITSDFKLVAFCNDNEIYAKSTYDDVKQVCEANKEELFRRIFVKISDCPRWMRDELQKERNKQIKKQRRREFLKKIFPFAK